MKFGSFGALALTLTLGLPACGGSDGGDTPGEAGQGGNAPAGAAGVAGAGASSGAAGSPGPGGFAGAAGGAGMGGAGLAGQGGAAGEGGAGAAGQGGGAGGAVAACAPAALDGFCPGKRSCVEGACLAPAAAAIAPVSDPVAFFDQVWTMVNETYGAFSVKTVDWAAVKTKYDALLADPANAPGAAWLITRAVAEIHDGHTSAVSKSQCTAYRGLVASYTNTGVCLTEVGGKMLVYQRNDTAPAAVHPGDELVALDGRPVDAALVDLTIQPACLVSWSTAAQDRAVRVSSLLWRVDGDAAVTLRHDDQSVEEVPLPHADKGAALITACDGRVGVGELTSMGGGVGAKLLADDVYYIRLPLFGVNDAQGNFSVQPAIDGLSAAFVEAEKHHAAILDLRSNPGGSPLVYEALASWLYPTPEVVYRCRYKAGPAADNFTALDLGMSTPSKTQSFTRPLALLTNARSFSAADFTTAYLHFTGRARTFGAADGGGYGNGNSKIINDEWTLGFNDALCVDPDGNPLEGHPPPVDQPVEYTAADLAAGVDTVIEAARVWAASP
jgi:C-terminal processing protease CtpA/Prc